MQYESIRVISHLCASLLVLVLVSSCVNQEYFAADTVPPDQVNIEKVDSVTIRYSDSAKVKVIVRALTLLRINEFSNNRQEFPDGIEVTFLNKDGTTNSILTANYAIRYEAKSGIIVQDNVVWSSLDGKRLETEELIWEEKEKKIHTQKLVHIVTEDQDIYGYGLEADQNFNHWSIIRPIGDLKINNLKN